MVKLRINYKFWLEEGERVFGDGPCDLLKRVDRLGSLRKAAQEMGMSYSQAWGLIKRLEEKLGFKLIISQTGGSEGGGSKLTSEARILVNAFSCFRKEAVESLNCIEERWFNKQFYQKIGLIRKI